MSETKKGEALVIGDDKGEVKLPPHLAAKVASMPTPEEKAAKAAAKAAKADERREATLHEKKKSLSMEFDKVKKAQEKAKEVREKGLPSQDNDPEAK